MRRGIAVSLRPVWVIKYILVSKTKTQNPNKPTKQVLKKVSDVEHRQWCSYPYFYVFFFY